MTWLLILVAFGGAAATLGKGTDDSFSIPGAESQEGFNQLNRTFPEVSGTSAQFIVLAADGTHVTDEIYREGIESTVAELEDLPGVVAVTSPFDEHVEGMVNDDSSAAMVRMQFEGEVTAVPAATKDTLTAEVAGISDTLPEGSLVSLGGELFAVEVPTVTPTEAVGLVIALLVLIVTFRSFVVAGLPLVTAVLGVGVSIVAIFAATAFAPVSSTTPLLALMLGLAVSIDYALFIVARHQDQVRQGMEPVDSTARAVGTAGSAVVFAGVTVMIALIGLSVAGIPFLTTMGVAAAGAVGVGVAIAVTLTPALLGFIGSRVAGKPYRERKPRKDKAPRERVPFSARWVRGATKWPILTSIGLLVGLGIVAIPSLSLNLALTNAGMLPLGSDARTNYDLVAEEFGPGFNGPLILTGTIITSEDPVTLMNDVGDEIASLPGVASVALATPNATADTGIVQVIPTTAPDDPETSALVRELRDQHEHLLSTYGVDFLVTGFTAAGIDISDQLGAALLPFGIFVIGLSLVLLTIVFRSLWVPITATLGYLLSVATAFGVAGAVFEWGWFADALHVGRTGSVISFMPIVLMGVLFGLAMDYHVFLVSRIREEFVHDPDSTSPSRTTRRKAALDAVTNGFIGSARVVTAAGLIMLAVFVAFVPEGDASLKPIALGLAAGIAVDAFLVRMTLIPALMAILGERAWTLPRVLERILPNVDIEGEAVVREQRLVGWPGDNSVIAADDAQVDGVTPGLDHVRVAAGEALIVTGGTAVNRRTLALAVAGRVPLIGGRMRVAGHLIPGQESWVRSHVGVILSTDHARATSREVREALRGAPTVVVIDAIDELDTATSDQLTALLRDLPRPPALLVTASDSERARETLGTSKSIIHETNLNDTRAAQVTP